jgi:hypothetical protein
MRVAKPRTKTMRGTMLVMPHAEKPREATLRKIARRRDYRLERCRRRDPQASGFGLYRLTDTRTGEVFGADAPGGFGLDLDAVAAILDRGRR